MYLAPNFVFLLVLIAAAASRTADGIEDERSGHSAGAADTWSRGAEGIEDERSGHSAGAGDTWSRGAKGTEDERSGHSPGAADTWSRGAEGIENERSGHFAGAADTWSRGAEGTPELHASCMYDGRWFRQGAAVAIRDPCLWCVCAYGALSCRRRGCRPLPDPPPHRCHVLHRKGSCCPELHCPDGTTIMEQEARWRLEDGMDSTGVAFPSSASHVCVEGGTAFTTGSALGSGVACEQCFCLGGTRRCVRPQCLPPPVGCRSRPAPGACCPQRYYCDHSGTRSPEQRHDCKVQGEWIAEGARAVTAEFRANCTRCFCLHGSVRCQLLSCAPPMLGCTPLIQPGECCAHQYDCPHRSPDNSLMTTKNDDRLLHAYTPRTSTKIKALVTNKVKRKTNEPHGDIKTDFLEEENISGTTITSRATTDLMEITSEEFTTTENFELLSTEQPEGSIKIVINGTVNCTSEYSFNSLLLNDTEIVKTSFSTESHTFSPSDIITNKYDDANLNENEMFTVNVTSTLMTNTSIPLGSIGAKTLATTELSEVSNISKKHKEDYDYDYSEPTLPPSLPNLQIIPFVAADAVVKGDDVTPKEISPFSKLPQDEKYPVYYPRTQDLATKRDDTYKPTRPLYTISNVAAAMYPLSALDVDQSDTIFSPNTNIEIDQETINRFSTNDAHRPKSPESTINIETPSVNLFSPPVETEGGFIPKAPGQSDLYYTTLASTQSAPSLTHLTSSIHLDTDQDNTSNKGTCVTRDGKQVTEGDTISLDCSVCSCAWGELYCSPRPCDTPPGCTRRPASRNVVDLCCGEMICEQDKTTAAMPAVKNHTKGNNIPLREEENSSSIVNVTAINSNISISVKTTTEVAPKFNENDDEIKMTEVRNDVALGGKTTNNSTDYQIQSNENNFSTLLPPVLNQHIESESDSIEQEYEDDEDEGFSLGSVLQLLLSGESYDSNKSPYKNKSAVVTKSTTTRSYTTPLTVPTTKKQILRTTTNIPLSRVSYTPPKKNFQPNTINRIDHLVLGESNAIQRPTFNITHSVFKPFVNTVKPNVTKVTLKSETNFSSTETNFKNEPKMKYNTSIDHENPRPVGANNPSGLILGLKLAGCNIYGKMYSVGKIINELTTSCQECTCTERGVECRLLNC